MDMLAKYSGKLITFEGIEGSGKSTNINFVAQHLRQHGIEVLLTREPGGTPMGEQIRAVILAHYTEIVSPMTELLLLFAARCQHIENVIKPALEAGSCVLCDRFTDASYAYQGGGRGLNAADIQHLENMVQQDLRPDLTIVFDVNVEISMQRIKKRKNIDRIETEQLDFFQRVKQLYLARANKNPSTYKIIDANQPLAVVQQNLAKLLADA